MMYDQMYLTIFVFEWYYISRIGVELVLSLNSS